MLVIAYYFECYMKTDTLESVSHYQLSICIDLARNYCNNNVHSTYQLQKNRIKTDFLQNIFDCELYIMSYLLLNLR